MMSTPEFPVRIFYDGSCSVCAREVEQYGRKDRHNRLILVDISDPYFKPEPFGIGLDQFMYQLHAIDRMGTVFRGVDAFWAIWQAFPSSTFLGLCGTVITLPLVNPVARLCYRAFANIRGYLPKRQRSCVTGSCSIGSMTKRKNR
ncbi:MAG: thiol-disulfide oxidoreductase [Geobacteraceae bacterium GWC2_53_11]|nr:MAG: thiol-disulfide oxidoreductase [Geobacteraceae bacterium GWC2_53_11]